jgi:conjugative transfer region protein (TIGR03750 family)
MVDEHNDGEALRVAPEVDRVNVEPAILLGLSSTEAVWTIAIAFAIWTPIAALLAILMGNFPLFILLDTTVPMLAVWLAAKKMATVKRNRPDLYYVHALRKWAARKGLRRSQYITHAGSWDVGRSLPPAHTPKQGLIRR